MVDRIRMPFLDAANDKWQAGRSLHSIHSPNSFSGDPLEELFEECLDGYNYASQAWLDNLISRETKQRWCDLFSGVGIEVQSLKRRSAASNHLGASRG